jgi:hypothetical protein
LYGAAVFGISSPTISFVQKIEHRSWQIAAIAPHSAFQRRNCRSLIAGR